VLKVLGFYILFFFLGLSFGGASTCFEASVWTMLPGDVDLANALGFAATLKVLGASIGTFVCGTLLGRWVRSPLD